MVRTLGTSQRLSRLVAAVAAAAAIGAIGVGSASARVANAEVCEQAQIEQTQLEKAGVRTSLQQGPQQAANLPPKRIEQVRRLIALDETLLFRCRLGGVALTEERTPLDTTDDPAAPDTQDAPAAGAVSAAPRAVPPRAVSALPPLPEPSPARGGRVATGSLPPETRPVRATPTLPRAQPAAQAGAQTGGQQPAAAAPPARSPRTPVNDAYVPPPAWQPVD